MTLESYHGSVTQSTQQSVVIRLNETMCHVALSMSSHTHHVSYWNKTILNPLNFNLYLLNKPVQNTLQKCELYD